MVGKFTRIDADPAIVEAWLWAQKKIFNDEYDITIRGIEVELYVEDVGSATMSNGIYSLFADKWVKFPERIEAEIDADAVSEQVDRLILDIENALNSDDIEVVEDEIDALYLTRKNGLSADGEFGVGNQTFKEIRNLGYLDKLKDKVVELKSEDLSILASKYRR